MRPPARILVAIAALLAAAAPALTPFLARSSTPADAALWRMLAVQLCFGGLALLAALRLGGSLRDRLGLVRGRFAAALLALGALGTLALSGALQFAVEALALTPGSTLEQLSELAATAAPSSPWLVALSFGLAPAISEELLCRGVLQRSLARAVGAWCVPLSALVFGALHMDPVHSPAAFLLGAYLGAVAWFGRTTWLAIACHLANNGAAALQQIAPDAGAGLPRPHDFSEAAAWLVGSGICLALVARSARPSRGDGGAASA